MAIDLTKIKLGYSGLTDSIYLFRHGKKNNEALDKRDAERDVMEVITVKMMDGCTGKGSSIEYRFGEQWYKMTVEKIEKKNYGKSNTS